MYSSALVEDFSENHILVGLCDNNLGRLNDRVVWAEARGASPRAYLAEDFDQMIGETHPDVVIVTSKDCTHADYICRAMEMGCDVITEKPLTTDAVMLQRIIDTQRRTGRECRVTFNYRYSPPRMQVKDLLMQGVIGEVHSVDFHWLLDIHHGADYFRRWHRNKSNSGGLMVHKATHHFDLINWWLSALPVSVFASGNRKFYTPQTADRYGLHRRAERCLICPEASRCPFALDMRALPGLNELYLNNERYDGYHRDQCVFSEQIDIEDTMNLVVNYEDGIIMSYSLNAFMPWEGYIVTFNGSRGRLEHKCMETVYISGDGSIPGALRSDGTTIRLYPHFSPAVEIPVWEAIGGHGGGDALMLRDIFQPEQGSDPYLRRADHRAGAYSILTGIAANQSLATGHNVRIDQLVHGVDRPEVTRMPDAGDPLPLPVNQS
jgi:predicted dehydrogenase